MKLSAADKRRYDLEKMREERDTLAGQMMLNAAGRARLAQLNALLG